MYHEIRDYCMQNECVWTLSTCLYIFVVDIASRFLYNKKSVNSRRIEIRDNKEHPFDVTRKTMTFGFVDVYLQYAFANVIFILKAL